MFQNENIIRLTEKIHSGEKRIMDNPILPSQIKRHLTSMKYDQIKVGCSSANVYRYSNGRNVLYLKISKADDEIRREHDLLVWLSGKLPVPEVKCWHEQDGFAYLLMTEVPGKMSCDGLNENTVKLLAKGLKMLWAVDITACPFDSTLENKLAGALYNIENGLVDMDDFENNNTFKTPMELYRWLVVNKPPEELCFTHGDYCLPNVLIDNGAVTGFIDVGRGGIADKWQDIALCVRSLGYNLGDIAQAEKDKHFAWLFSHLGIPSDWVKADYYILLDELF